MYWQNIESSTNLTCHWCCKKLYSLNYYSQCAVYSQYNVLTNFTHFLWRVNSVFFSVFQHYMLSTYTPISINFLSIVFKFQRNFLKIFSSNFYSYNRISDLDLSYDTDLTLSLNAKGTALTNSARLHTLMRALSMLILVQVWSPSHRRSHHFYRRNQRGSDVNRGGHSSDWNPHPGHH